MARAIKRYVDVEITKETPKVASAAFGKLLVLTNSETLTLEERVRRFTTDAEVSDFFGGTSEEYKAANAFFNQNAFNDNFPEDILFGRINDSESSNATLLTGVAIETVISEWVGAYELGCSFDIEIDGVRTSVNANFIAVTSLDDVAAAIDSTLGADVTCVYLSTNGRFLFTRTDPEGSLSYLLPTTIPGHIDLSSAYLDGQEPALPGPDKALLTPAVISEEVDEALQAIIDTNDEWYTLGVVKAFRDTDALIDAAGFIESLRKIFISTTNNPLLLDINDTTSVPYQLKQANRRRTGFIYHDVSDYYPDMAWLGLQLPKPVGSTNWSYKTLPGIADGALVDIPPVSLTEGQKNALKFFNVNSYTSTLSASHTYRGIMVGGKNPELEGEKISLVRNVDFLQARLEEGIFSLLLERDIIPFTNAGITIVDNRLKSRLNTYGVQTGILIGSSVTTSFQKRSEVSQENRDDGILPDGKFSGRLQGEIDMVIIRGTVSI